MARVWLLVCLLLGAAASRADADTKPWATGVAPDAQKKALALYKEGNAFFQQAQYKEALVKYELALAVWDHPAIRYNAAVCLINLDRLSLAWDNLASALRFGEPPLGADLYKEALRYQKQLAGQLGTVAVQCDVSGADVQLDGEALFVGPGTATRRLVAGAHRLVTSKEPDYVSDTRIVEVAGGSTQIVKVDLARREVKTIAVARPTRIERRFATWIPYAVMGAGVVIGGAGGLYYAKASDKYDDYDRQSNMICAPLGGCAEGTPARTQVDRFRDKGDTYRLVSYTGFALGGVAVAGGIVLALVNQPRAVLITPTSERPGLAISGSF